LTAKAPIQGSNAQGLAVMALSAMPMSSMLAELLVGMGPPLPCLSCTYKPNGSSNLSHVDNISDHNRVLDSSSSSNHIHHYELAQAALHSYAVSTTSVAVITCLTSTAAMSATHQRQQHQQLQLPLLP